MAILSLTNKNARTQTQTKNKRSQINIEYATVGETIDVGMCISVFGGRIFRATSTLKTSSCDGIALKAGNAGEIASFVTYGRHTNKNYHFSPPFGRAVWLSPSGAPSDIPPASGTLQQVGVSLSESEFMVKILHGEWLDHAT